MGGSRRVAFSRPWAWGWTVAFAVASGVGVYLLVVEGGVGWGWGLAVGLVGFAGVGSYCAFFAIGRGTEELPIDSDVDNQS